MEELEFLGFIIEKQGVKVDPQEGSSSDGLATPYKSKRGTTVHGVRPIHEEIHPSFHIAAPLTELIKGKAPFHWGEAQKSV